MISISEAETNYLHALFSILDVTDSPTCPSTYDQKQNNMKATNEDIYAMNHNPHGVCLIINNKEFLGGLSERTGTDVDAMKLKDLFSSLNFTVKVINNASGKQMRDAIKNVAEMDHSVTDCVVVCLLSHGIYDKIYASDCELIPSSELLEPLVRCEQRPQLAGKPRLFFIQACRVVGPVENKHADAGEAKLNAFEVTVHSKGDDEFLASTEQEASSSELLMQESAAPLPANILMSYSTFPGKESWRHLETGSWFIDALVGVFEKYARKEDVMSMIVRVNDAVSKRVSSVGKSKQIPAPFFSLTKKLFFFPQR